MTMMSRHQPEPCLKGQCRSPIACGGFGYCRERNMRDGTPRTRDEFERRRSIASALLDRATETVADLGGAGAAAAIVVLAAITLGAL